MAASSGTHKQGGQKDASPFSCASLTRSRNLLQQGIWPWLCPSWCPPLRQQKQAAPSTEPPGPHGVSTTVHPGPRPRSHPGGHCPGPHGGKPCLALNWDLHTPPGEVVQISMSLVYDLSNAFSTVYFRSWQTRVRNSQLQSKCRQKFGEAAPRLMPLLVVLTCIVLLCPPGDTDVVLGSPGPPPSDHPPCLGFNPPAAVQYPNFRSRRNTNNIQRSGFFFF